MGKAWLSCEPLVQVVGSEQTLHKNNKGVQRHRRHRFVSVAMESRVKIDTLWSSRTRNVLFGSLKSSHSDSSSVPLLLGTHPISSHRAAPGTRAAARPAGQWKDTNTSFLSPLTTLAGGSGTRHRSRAEIW